LQKQLVVSPEERHLKVEKNMKIYLGKKVKRQKGKYKGFYASSPQPIPTAYRFP